MLGDRRLYDNSFQEWKLIPLFLIKNSFGSSFKFHSNIFFKRNKIKFFPSFYKEMFFSGKNILPESLKYQFAFCLNIYGTMKISR